MTSPYAEVIGDPVAHSKSPTIHRFWIEKLGLDADYRARHVTPAGLAGYFSDRRADPDWRGCNVTIPHKGAALDHADRWLDPAAKAGATNCIFADPTGLLATNTDIGGFLEPLAGIALAGKHAFVIGAGGAARAVVLALAERGIGRLTVCNRDLKKARGLVAGLGIDVEAVALAEAAPDADLLVNASPLGMAGYPDPPISVARLPEEAVVYDLVYAPLETRLLAAARARGLRTIDGLAMLVGQAAAAFSLFFASAAPREHDAELRALLLR